MTAPTPPVTTNIADFLRARLDEDEELAREAGGSRWLREMTSCVVSATCQGLIVYGEGTPSREQADHIARHDPARVLADVGAKRRIIEEHAEFQWAETIESEPTGQGVCRKCADWVNCDFDGPPHDAYPCDTLKILALPYQDHPDYQPEWEL